MSLSTFYYIAEIEGGERVVLTDNVRSLKANMRFGYDRALRFPHARAKEPIDPCLNREHAMLLQSVIEWGRKRRNKAAS